MNGIDMNDRNALIQPDRGQQAIALHLVDKTTLPDLLKSLNTGQRASIAAQILLALRRCETRQGVKAAAKFESAHALEVFALEERL